MSSRLLKPLRSLTEPQKSASRVWVASMVLLPAALVTDRADAVLAIRPYAKEKWCLGFNAYSDARLARRASQTRQPFLNAALHVNGVVTDTTLLMALQHAPPESLVALVTTRRVPVAMLEQLLANFVGQLPLQTLRTWHAQRQISLAVYLRMAAPERSVAQGEALLEEVALGEIDGAQTLAYLAPPWAQVLTWLEESLLDGAHVLAAFPGIDEKAVRGLFGAGFIDVGQFVGTGKASDAELQEFVKNGDISAVACMNACAVSEVVAHAWLQRGYIEEALYTTKRGEHWLRGEPISRVHIRRARQSRDINATLLALPAPQDAAVRYSMRLRLYAEWVIAQNETPAPQLWRRPLEQLSVRLHTIATHVVTRIGHLGLVYGTAAALRGMASYLTSGVAPSSSLPKSSGTCTIDAPTCFACTDTFDDANPALSLAGCQHPPILHAECLRADFAGRMELGYPARCPVVECGHPTSIANGLAMGLDADQLDTLAMSIVRRYRTPYWADCPTAGCVSGADVPPHHGLLRDCAMCEKPVTFGDLDRDLQQTRDVVLEMIEGMGPPRR